MLPLVTSRLLEFIASEARELLNYHSVICAAALYRRIFGLCTGEAGDPRRPTQLNSLGKNKYIYIYICIPSAHTVDSSYMCKYRPARS